MLYQLTPLSPVRTLPEFYVDNAFIPTGEAHLLEVRDAKSYVMRLFVDECSGSDFIPSSSPGAWLECTTAAAPEQPCQQKQPPDSPAVPTNEISSTPLTSADVLDYFQQTDIVALMQMVAALGQEEDTAAMSREQLVESAWGEFTATMAELEIEKVDASGSLAGFEQGPVGWRYMDGRSDEVA
ncbi:MAG: hypothetical protein Q9215_004477 [Flavoplaca cf. flavocitrina]